MWATCSVFAANFTRGPETSAISHGGPLPVVLVYFTSSLLRPVGDPMSGSWCLEHRHPGQGYHVILEARSARTLARFARFVALPTLQFHSPVYPPPLRDLVFSPPPPPPPMRHQKTRRQTRIISTNNHKHDAKRVHISKHHQTHEAKEYTSPEITKHTR